MIKFKNGDLVRHVSFPNVEGKIINCTSGNFSVRWIIGNRGAVMINHDSELMPAFKKGDWVLVRNKFEGAVIDSEYGDDGILRKAIQTADGRSWYEPVELQHEVLDELEVDSAFKPLIDSI